MHASALTTNGYATIVHVVPAAIGHTVEWSWRRLNYEWRFGRSDASLHASFSCLRRVSLWVVATFEYKLLVAPRDATRRGSLSRTEMLSSDLKWPQIWVCLHRPDTSTAPHFICAHPRRRAPLVEMRHGQANAPTMRGAGMEAVCDACINAF